MSLKPPGPIRRLWYRWKMAKLPWRKQWLVGFDLQGNTFWEFQDSLNSNRYRRIIKYSKWTHHGDVNVPPQWMQWLRHTRFDPPSISEQEAEVVRQARIKQLAAQADARWASQPSVLDAPDKQQPVQMLLSKDPNTGLRQTNGTERGPDEITRPEADMRADTAGEVNLPQKGDKDTKKTPLPKQPSRVNPGEGWQPESWAPKPAKRRN